MVTVILLNSRCLTDRANEKSTKASNLTSPFLFVVRLSLIESQFYWLAREGEIGVSDAFVIHVNFDDLLNEAAKLRNVDQNLEERLVSLVTSLREITLKLEPALRREEHDDEHQLWQEYTQLQKEKLLVLDLSHEYDFIEKKVQALNPDLNILIKDAIEELNEHISVRVKTHRAHIDILEIRNARRLSVNAIVISATIAYIAVWEYSFREFITGIVFPDGLSPVLNYLVAVLTILPVFVMILWSFLTRRTRM